MSRGGILIADGMDFFRQWLRSLLTGWGWRVAGEAGDGEAAVRMAAELGPDLVILDLHLLGLDGFAILERLRREAPRAAVIVCSAAGRRENVVRALKLGASDFLAKPVAEERLFAAVARVLGAPAGAAPAASGTGAGPEAGRASGGGGRNPGA